MCDWTHTWVGGATAFLPLAMTVPLSACGFACVYVCGGGAWGGCQLDSALRSARARGGRGACVWLDPYQEERSVGGLGLGLGCPALRLLLCVLGGKGGGEEGPLRGLASGEGGVPWCSWTRTWKEGEEQALAERAVHRIAKERLPTESRGRIAKERRVGCAGGEGCAHGCWGGRAGACMDLQC